MCNPRLDIRNLGLHIRRGVGHAYTPLLMCNPGLHIWNLGIHIRRGVNACPTPLLMCNPRFHITILGLHIRRGVVIFEFQKGSKVLGWVYSFRNSLRNLIKTKPFKFVLEAFVFKFVFSCNFLPILVNNCWNNFFVIL